MDSILIAVTSLSVVLTITMAVLLARMVREERRRSNARVELLAQLAKGGRTRAAAPAASVRPRGDDPGDLELRPAAETAAPAAAGSLFGREEQASMWPRRLGVIGALAVLVALGALAWNTATRPTTPAVKAASTVAQPLELLSLRHTPEQEAFTVTGLVQNPHGAGVLRGVEATVLVFAADGAMLTSARAPLDFTTLGAGDESPFVIRVPITTPVARYRVGFRTADGRVLGHVDRRTPSSTAQRQDP